MSREPTRFDIYRRATGSNDWGPAPRWIGERYFEFCQETGAQAYSTMTPAGWPMAMIRPEQQKPFHAWLIAKYMPEYAAEPAT